MWHHDDGKGRGGIQRLAAPVMVRVNDVKTSELLFRPQINALSDMRHPRSSSHAGLFDAE
jgi:hypothetical protein